jgi:hypothetical protein
MKWVERGLTNSVAPATRSFVTQVTENVLTAAAVGPMGLKYPVR